MKKEKILFFIFLLILVNNVIAANIEPNIYYKLNLKYDNGKITIESNNIEFKNKKIDNYYGLYSAKLMDFNGKILSTTNFDVSNEVLVDYADPVTGQINGGGMIELNETEFELYIPYSENAKDIVIFGEKSEEMIKLSVSEYSKSNQIITEGTKNSNEEGTKSKTDKTDNSIANNNKGIFNYWWILLILIVMVVISIIFIKKRGKK